MAYTPLRISIPEPCHEDWDRMTPVGDNRRHCASCEKSVTDFSWMTDREIHQYLTVSGNNLCGRFRRDQLDRPVRAYVKPSTGWRAAAAAGGLLLSAGAAAQVPGADVVVDQAPPYTELSEIINGEVEKEARMKGVFRGVVTDEEGEPLIGATVLIIGTTTGTVTDFDGQFELTVKAGQVLKFSYIGYESLSHRVKRNDSGFVDEGRTLIMAKSVEELTGIVVTGYSGVMGKMVVGGTVSVVDQMVCLSQTGLPLPESECEPSEEVTTIISPNPFTDRLTAEFTSEARGSVSAQLWHVNGQMIRHWPDRRYEAGPVRLEFPLGNAPLVPGHYILRLTDQTGKVTSQVVVHQ